MKQWIAWRYTAVVFSLSAPFFANTSIAATAVRPVVQQNFQTLLETRSCPGCDLAGADLTRANLKGVNLEGANLAGSKLTLADLSGANLKKANLQGANLGGADMAQVDLDGANLTGAILEGAFLDSAKMKGTIATRPPAEDAPAHGGEKVFVPDESQSKSKPYTQDLGDATVSQPEEKAAQKPAESVPVAPMKTQSSPTVAPVLVKPQTDQSQSKKLVPMSEAIVPAKETQPTAPMPTSSNEAAPSADGQTVATAATPAAPVEVQPEPMAKATPKVQPDDAKIKESRWPDKGAPLTAASTGESALKPQPVVSAPEEKNTSNAAASSQDARPAANKPLSAGPKATEQKPMAEPPVSATSPQPADQAEKITEVAATEGSVKEQKIAEPKADLPDASSEVAKKAISAPAAPKPAEISADKQRLIAQLFEKKRCVDCDLAQVDLSGKDMDGFDLERSNLQGSNLRGADLGETNLKGANFSDAQLQDADMRKADLYRTNFSGADLTGARLEKALVDATDFTGAVGVNLDGAVVSK